MVALYGMVIPQLCMLIATNILLLLYLLKVRPYINKLNLIFTLLFVLSAIALEAMQIYFFKYDAILTATQKTNIGHPFVIALCSVLMLLVVWALWRIVWEASFYVRNFKGTLLYLEYADHDYEGEKEES